MKTAFVPICEQNDNDLSQSVLACSVCGQNHDTNNCSLVQNIHYVPDAPLISRARQTLPENLEIVNMADGTTTVITKIILQQGTTFGPLYAKKLLTMNPLSNFPVKVFGNVLSETYYLDFSNENSSNWMCFISPASDIKEQNLICHQVKQDIYYTALRTIAAGEEIRVWYAPYYALKMQMPLHDNNFNTGNTAVFSESKRLPVNKVQPVKQSKADQTVMLSKEVAEELANKLPAQHLGAANNMEVWNCKFCLTTTKSVVSYAKHLMDHYKPLLGTFCNICSKKCNNASALKRHKNAKHTEVIEDDVGKTLLKENLCNSSQADLLLRVSDSECEMLDTKKDTTKQDTSDKKADSVVHAFSQQNEKEFKSGLSFLDTTLLTVSDLLQNDRCLNINLGINVISETTIPDQESNSVKFNIEGSLPELLENVHEKLNNLDCDICDKKFDKVDYLYRHLRKHTGEFICPSCLVVFARKENLLSHACASKNLEYNYECSYCQKLFTEKKYLKRHMDKHNETINCKWCHSIFDSVAERTLHKCTAPHYICETCKRRFVNKAHLSRHIRSHSNPTFAAKKIRKRKQDVKSSVCEKCGGVFKNPYSLKQHLHTHGEKMFECDVCHSRFHRMAVLKEHRTIHQNAQVPCNVCGKRLKSKKALDIHMLLHGNKKHQCEKCDRSFFQKCNYLKHYKHMHEDTTIYTCHHCSVTFTSKQSFDKHIVHHLKPATYTCILCKKSYHSEHQLKRHKQTSHSGIIYRCPFCHITARYRHSMRRHFERLHESSRIHWDKFGFINQFAEQIPELSMDQVTNKQHELSVHNESYVNEDPHKLEQNTVNQDVLSEERGVTVTEDIQQEEKSDREIIIESDAADNEHVIALIGSADEDQVSAKDTDTPLNEVSQLNINEASDTVSESLLRNAYIYEDDGGDIMFYVL